jgi:hypothetical protein
MNVHDRRFSRQDANAGLESSRGQGMLGRPSRAATVPFWQKSRRSRSLATVVMTSALALTTILAACGSVEEESSAPVGQTAVVTPTNATNATAAVTTPAAAVTPTTRVAPTPTRTPRPVNTPTPMPPPVPAIGDSVQTNGWVLSVSEFETFNRIGERTADGMYLYLRMTITNAGNTAEPFPFEGLIVVDQNQQTHFIDLDATRESLQYDFGIDIAAPLQAGETRNVAAAFDIPFDATDLRLTTPSRVFEIRLEYREAPK